VAEEHQQLVPQNKFSADGGKINKVYNLEKEEKEKCVYRFPGS
jgi:hypothetical protein